MSVSELLQIGMAGLTMFASIISLCTLWEMKKQRKASMMPNIAIDSTYYIKLNGNLDFGNTDENKGFPYFLQPDAEDIRFKENSLSYQIQLSNVGLGTAINVKYKWKFNFDAYENIVKKYEEKSLAQILKRDNRIIWMPARSISQSRGLENERFRISHIRIGEPVSIVFCQEFMMLFVAAIYLMMEEQSDSKTGENIIEHMENLQKDSRLPELIVNYEDVSGNKYVETFSFGIDFTMIGLDKTSFRLNVYKDKNPRWKKDKKRKPYVEKS